MKTLAETNNEAAALAEQHDEEFRARCHEMIRDAIEHTCVVIDLARLQHTRLALKEAACGANVEKVYFPDVEIACDECGFELFAFGREMLLSDPPANKVGCAACGFVGQLAIG